MDPEAILATLNTEQREAAQAVTGPVVILAGAGTGKTRVISHRVAYAAATGAIDPKLALVVTFTEKAAAEMGHRLRALGLPQVQASTFHAAARRQLAHFWPEIHGRPLPDVLDSKLRIIGPLARQLPGGYKFTPAKDLADEIEWAKVRRMRPETYEPERDPPVPKDVFTRFWRSYELGKARADRIDFEDMLTLAVELYEGDEDAIGLAQAALQLVQRRRVPGHEPAPGGPAAALARRSARPLRRRRPRPDDLQLHRRQQRLPDHLRGPIRRCARRAPQPELPQHAPGAGARQPAHRRPRIALQRGPMDRSRSSSPIPTATESSSRSWAASARSGRRRRRHRDRRPRAHERAARRLRGRAQRRRHPVQRPRHAILRPPRRARRPRGVDEDGCDRTALAHRRQPWRTELGFDEASPAGPGAETRDRHAALSTLLAIARRLEVEQPDATVADFLAELARRDAAEADAGGEGVTLSTLHRAKGLEWDAVFLPQLEEGTLPIRQAASDFAALAEERRLLYVGITRARRHLVLSWAHNRVGVKGTSARARPSRFIAELRPGAVARPRAAIAVGAAGPLPTFEVGQRVHHARRGPGVVGGPSGDSVRVDFDDGAIGVVSVRDLRASLDSAADEALLERLTSWRRERARADGVPAYVVADNKTLAAIAAQRPSDEAGCWACRASVSARSRRTARRSWSSSPTADASTAVLSGSVADYGYESGSARRPMAPREGA